MTIVISIAIEIIDCVQKYVLSHLSQISITDNDCHFKNIYSYSCVVSHVSNHYTFKEKHGQVKRF